MFAGHGLGPMNARFMATWLPVVLPAVFLFSHPALLAEGDLQLRPAEDRFGGAIDKIEAPSFRRHVIPLASKLGCSGRECHGSLQGRGGFRLSLFGYDFGSDHTALTADKENRIRVNLKEPEKSLVLQKPTRQVKHKGGEIFEQGSWEYNVWLKWIQGGAKMDVKETGTFARLEVFPREIVFQKAGEERQLYVVAHWADGTTEDVTGFTRFRANDESVAEVHEGGRVVSKSKGDTHIVAFYDNGVAPVPVMLPVNRPNAAAYPKLARANEVDDHLNAKLRKLGIVPSGASTDAEFLRRASLDVTGTLPAPGEVRAFLKDRDPDKRAKKIDELLERPGYAAWWATKLSDFTGNNARNLLDRQYANQMARQWYDWIFHRLQTNEPYDKLVEGMVMATGRSRPDQGYLEFAEEMSSYYREENPADFAKRPNLPQFWARRNIAEPKAKAQSFAYAFLGVRIQCAECHKHPFDQWTQQDYEQFQGFFAPIKFGNRVVKGEKDNHLTLMDAIRKEAGFPPLANSTPQQRARLPFNTIRTRVQQGEPVPWQEVYVERATTQKLTDAQLAAIRRRNPTFSGRVLTPKILGGDEGVLAKYADARQPLMDWLRSPQNPYFAKAFVNRVWASYFGRGLVNPVDDLNLANAPSNPALFNYLARTFIEKGFDMKWLHRQILNSAAYQRSWQPNETNVHDEKNFSRFPIRRLEAEVVADAIAMAIAPDGMASVMVQDHENRAIGPNVNYNNNPFAAFRRGPADILSLFGKPARTTDCDCERSNVPTLRQMLYTRNDPGLLARIEGTAPAANRGNTRFSTNGMQQPARQRNDSNSWIKGLRAATGRRAEGGEVWYDPAHIKRALATIERREKMLMRMKPPVPPGMDEKQMMAMAGMAKKMKIWNEQWAKVQAMRAEQEALWAKHKPAQLPRDEDGNIDRVALIEETFLRTLSRLPSAEELSTARADVASAKDLPTGIRDLLWALLNTREFIVNH